MIEEYVFGFLSFIIGYDMFIFLDLEWVLGFIGIFLFMFLRVLMFVVVFILYLEYGYDFEIFSNCSGVLLFYKVLRRIVFFVISYFVFWNIKVFNFDVC